MDALLSLPSWIYVGLAVLALLFVTTKPASRSFDLSSVANPTLQFKMKHDTEAGFDRVHLERGIPGRSSRADEQGPVRLIALHLDEALLSLLRLLDHDISKRHRHISSERNPMTHRARVPAPGHRCRQRCR